MKATMDEIALEAEITKPTIYLYFKAKDDLFFTLMVPLIDDIRMQMEAVEKNLSEGRIGDGRSLIESIFRAFYYGYEASPDIFRIIQLFQQQGLIGELKPEIRMALNDAGRINFVLGRRILTRGIEMGLIRQVDVYEMADVIWGLTVGIIQLEDTKSDDLKGHRLKTNTLRLAERLIAAALTNCSEPTSEKGGNDGVLGNDRSGTSGGTISPDGG